MKPSVNTDKRDQNTPPYDNSSGTQRQRILRWFKHNSPRLSTLQARAILGIMSPAARVMEIKSQGHKIVLQWIYERDSNGVEHRMGEYVYFGRMEDAS